MTSYPHIIRANVKQLNCESVYLATPQTKSISTYLPHLILSVGCRRLIARYYRRASLYQAGSSKPVKYDLCDSHNRGSTVSIIYRARRVDISGENGHR